MTHLIDDNSLPEIMQKRPDPSCPRAKDGPGTEPSVLRGTVSLLLLRGTVSQLLLRGTVSLRGLCRCCCCSWLKAVLRATHRQAAQRRTGHPPRSAVQLQLCLSDLSLSVRNTQSHSTQSQSVRLRDTLHHASLPSVARNAQTTGPTATPGTCRSTARRCVASQCTQSQIIVHVTH